MRKDKATKAIISAGGKSLRIKKYADAHGGKMFLPVNHRPLITYQINSLRNAGVKEICFTITSHGVKEKILQFIKQKRIPNLKYRFYLFPYTGCLFDGLSAKKMYNYTKTDTVWFLECDLFYPSHLLETILRKSTNLTALIGIIENLKPHHQFGFNFDKSNNLKQIIKRKDDNIKLYNLRPPFLFGPKGIKSFIASLSKEPSNYLKAFKSILDQGTIVGVKDKIFNINTQDDYHKLLKRVKRNPQ